MIFFLYILASTDKRGVGINLVFTEWTFNNHALERSESLKQCIKMNQTDWKADTTEKGVFVWENMLCSTPSLLQLEPERK